MQQLRMQCINTQEEARLSGAGQKLRALPRPDSRRLHRVGESHPRRTVAAWEKQATAPVDLKASCRASAKLFTHFAAYGVGTDIWNRLKKLRVHWCRVAGLPGVGEAANISFGRCAGQMP